MLPTTCLCTQLRRASRGVTRRYDDALAAVGLGAAQFSLLRHVQRVGQPSIAALAEEAFERGVDRIERGDRGQAERGAALLEPGPHPAVDQREQHQPGIGGDLRHDPVEVVLRADHRPEVADDVGVVVLGERGLGDHLQRLAGRIREQVEVEPVHGLSAYGAGTALWKARAQACRGLGGQSPATDSRPQRVRPKGFRRHVHAASHRLGIRRTALL